MFRAYRNSRVFKLHHRPDKWIYQIRILLIFLGHEKIVLRTELWHACGHVDGHVGVHVCVRIEKSMSVFSSLSAVKSRIRVIEHSNVCVQRTLIIFSSVFSINFFQPIKIEPFRRKLNPFQASRTL